MLNGTEWSSKQLVTASNKVIIQQWTIMVQTFVVETKQTAYRVIQMVNYMLQKLGLVIVPF